MSLHAYTSIDIHINIPSASVHKRPTAKAATASDVAISGRRGRCFARPSATPPVDDRPTTAMKVTTPCHWRAPSTRRMVRLHHVRAVIRSFCWGWTLLR